MRWVQVVAVEASAEVGLAEAVDVAQGVWEAPRLPDRVATVSVLVVGTASRTWWACPVTRKSAPNAAHR